MAESNLARPLVALTDEPLQQERAVRSKPVLTLIARRIPLWNGRSMESRFSRRRIQIDESFKLFRVY
jgi:hypothetical protein